MFEVTMVRLPKQQLDLHVQTTTGEDALAADAASASSRRNPRLSRFPVPPRDPASSSAETLVVVRSWHRSDRKTRREEIAATGTRRVGRPRRPAGPSPRTGRTPPRPRRRALGGGRDGARFGIVPGAPRRRSRASRPPGSRRLARRASLWKSRRPSTSASRARIAVARTRGGRTTRRRSVRRPASRLPTHAWSRPLARTGRLPPTRAERPPPGCRKRRQRAPSPPPSEIRRGRNEYSGSRLIEGASRLSADSLSPNRVYNRSVITRRRRSRSRRCRRPR